jgi:hypothetical protein
VKAEMEMSMMSLKVRDIERKLQHIHSDLLEIDARTNHHDGQHAEQC